MSRLDSIISHKVYDSDGVLVADQPQPMQFEGGLTVESVGGKTVISTEGAFDDIGSNDVDWDGADIFEESPDNVSEAIRDLYYGLIANFYYTDGTNGLTNDLQMDGNSIADRRFASIYDELDNSSYADYDAGGDWDDAELVYMHEDGATASDVYGLSLPVASSGHLVKMLIHDGSDDSEGLITFKHESGSASFATHRIWTPDGNDLHFREGQIIFAIYDLNVERWRLFLFDGRDPRVYYLQLSTDGVSYDAHEKKVTNAGDPTDPQDLTTKSYVDSETLTLFNAVVADSIATDKLLGRDTAGTGEVEQISVGGNLEFTGSGAIQRGALTGDVTASAGSGSTTIPSNTVTYAKQQDVSAASRLIGRGSAAGSGDPEEITLGANLSLVGTVLTPSLSPAGLVAPSYNAVQDDSTSGASKTINFATGLAHKLTLDAATPVITYQFPGPGWYQIRYTQDATGSRVPTYAVSGGTVKKVAGFTLSTGANTTDIVTIHYDGTDAWQTVLPDFS